MNKKSKKLIRRACKAGSWYSGDEYELSKNLEK